MWHHAFITLINSDDYVIIAVCFSIYLTVCLSATLQEKVYMYFGDNFWIGRPWHNEHH